MVQLTADVAVALIVVALAVGLVIREDAGRSRAFRAVWTAAWIVYLLHVLASFHYAHHWSDDAAWRHVAERTRETTGLDWGGGLWVNYAFTLAWSVDIALRWFEPSESASGSWMSAICWSWIRWAWQGSFAIVVLSATIVFARPALRWPSAAAVVLLVALGIWRAKRHRVPNHSAGFGLPR